MQTREARLTSFLEGDLGDAIKALDLAIESDHPDPADRMHLRICRDALRRIKGKYT